jgi:uncharacterized protein YgfB (UPF0149 family)
MTTLLVNDIAATLKSFVDAMGSGKSATKHLATLVQDCANAGDTRPLSNAINRLDKKGDVSGSRVVRQIFNAVFVDAKAKMNKDKTSIILSISRDEAKVVKVNGDALARLCEAAEKGLSIRDALVKRVKGEAGAMAKTDADKLAKAYVAASHKRVDGEACTLLENVEAMRMALKTLEAELVASA